jgi:hypothetical protein
MHRNVMKNTCITFGLYTKRVITFQDDEIKTVEGDARQTSG